MNQTINDNPDGYWETYYSNGQLSDKGNYINGKEEGYWEEYNKDGRLIVKEYNII